MKKSISIHNRKPRIICGNCGVLLVSFEQNGDVAVEPCSCVYKTQSAEEPLEGDIGFVNGFCDDPPKNGDIGTSSQL